MEGIVIKSIDYKEKSKLVYLYTSSGIISVKALDANRHNLGFVTTLNQVEFQMTNASLPTVTEYSLKKSFYSMNQSIEKMGVLAPILDVILHLENDANHARIYPFLLKTLNELEETKEPLFVLCVFLIKMLAVFGIKPELNHCIRCAKKKIVNFSIIDGGALCDDCSVYNENNYYIFDSFKKLYYNNLYSFCELGIDYPTLIEAIYSYYTVHGNFKLKKYKL